MLVTWLLFSSRIGYINFCRGVRRRNSPQLYAGQHWSCCRIARHPGLVWHCLRVQANPGGRHWHSSQGSAVGSRWPAVYSTPSTAHTSKGDEPVTLDVRPSRVCYCHCYIRRLSVLFWYCQFISLMLFNILDYFMRLSVLFWFCQSISLMLFNIRD